MILSPLVRGRDSGTLCCGGMILLPFGVRGKMLVPFDVGNDAVALWNMGGVSLLFDVCVRGDAVAVSCLYTQYFI